MSDAKPTSASQRDRAPIFILGTMRSGTTLMRVILNRHPHIEIGPESGFMRSVQSIKTVPNWKFGKSWYERFGLSEADLNHRIRKFYGEIFLEHANTMGKRRWGEKTPFHRFDMLEISQIFPDALFLVMLRHAGAVCMSLKKWEYDLESSVKDWVQSYRRMSGVTRRLGEDRVFWCRYECLLSRPEATLASVMKFLGEPFVDALLAPRRGPDQVLEGGTRTGDEIDVSRIDRWLAEISPAEQQVVETLAGATLESFGYQLRTATPPEEDRWPWLCAGG